MQILENLENKYRSKADESSVSVEESKQWYSHPCTQQLVSSLVASALEKHLRLGNANHMSYDITKSMLEATKITAELNRIKDTIEKIEEIRDNVDNEASRPQGYS